MKRTFFNRNLRALLATAVLLLGLSLFADQASAQSYNWVSEPQAIARLSAEIDQLSLDIQNFVPGSNLYKDLENKIAYYKLISVSIEEGATTGTATTESLPRVNDRFSTAQDFIPKAQLAVLFDDAVILLTN